MFALLMLEGELRINLKCDPLLAIELRDHNEGVLPGYHMSKKHWNTIVVDKVHRDELKGWIDNSYQLVADSLTLKEKEEIKNL
jgi:predicted DNA-binding protein (MmcQ/YjbR family)